MAGVIGEVQLPPPRNWQDFETLCLLLWREIWRDPGAQKNGRNGQAQNGVDIYGRPHQSKGWAGVQCKGKGNYEAPGFTEAELRTEVGKARGFTPALASFTVATTAPDDAAMQAVARGISEENRKAGGFDVSVWGWGTISTELVRRPHLIRELYQDHFPDPNTRRLQDGGLQFRLFPDEPLLELAERFDGPRLAALIQNPLRDDLKALFSELCLNSFRHGRARTCILEVHRAAVVFSDDGELFNPIVAPEETWRAGLTFLSLFLKKYRDRMTFEYEARGGSNVVRLVFSDALTSPTLVEDCVVRVDCPPELYLNHGEHLARVAYIPANCDRLRFYVVPGLFNPSSLVMFVRALLQRMPPEVVLELVFADGDDLLRDFAQNYFRDQQVAIA